MKRIVISVSLFLIFFSAFAGAADEDAEEQGSAYEENADQPAPLPEYRAPARPSYSPRGVLSRSIDVTVLFLGLLAASFIFVRKKAPGYARLLLFFSMLYFGFFRHGCVCAPGALGNIGMAAFHSSEYVIDIFTVLIFFIPLLFALLSGRVFCGMLCPLGAVQECVSVRQRQVPRFIDKLLSWGPLVVLGIICWQVFFYRDLIMCRLDPFVSIFRLQVHLSSLLYSAGFLAVCIFIYRPFCKYLCPYGMILGLLSRISIYRKSFSSSCKKCGRCAEKCPTGCIEGENIDFSKCIACNRCVNPVCKK